MWWHRSRQTQPSTTQTPDVVVVNAPDPGVLVDPDPGVLGHNGDSPTERKENMVTTAKGPRKAAPQTPASSNGYPAPGLLGDTRYGKDGKVHPEKSYLSTAPTPGDQK